jgi:hypothetical protein
MQKVQKRPIDCDDILAYKTTVQKENILSGGKQDLMILV